MVTESQKPVGAKNVNTLLTGKKQSPLPNIRVYTKDMQQINKIFTSSLVKEGRLSVIIHQSNGCMLFITKSQEKLFDDIKLPEMKWPIVFVNEFDDKCVDQFYKQMNTMGIDLHNILETGDDKQ